MGKIFKISGNFAVDGKWTCAGNLFEGEIVLSDDNTFCGFCSEQDAAGETNISSISGIYTSSEKHGRKSLSFFKSASGSNKQPIICSIPDPSISMYGTWGVCEEKKYKQLGKAKVLITECPYSAQSEQHIKNNYNRITNLNPVAAIS